MEERWRPIRHFPSYSVSDLGQIRNDNTGRILSQSYNQNHVPQVGLMRDGKQFHRSVPKLVALAFIPHPLGPFDTPINLDGDRANNRVENLMWRPRWFAVEYNRQFRIPYHDPILYPILEVQEDGEVFYENSFHCATVNGLLEKDVVLSILNNTVVWPTYQAFGVVYPAD